MTIAGPPPGQTDADDSDIVDKVTAAIESAITAAVNNGTIDNPEDAVVIMNPDGHITVLPKDEADTVQVDDDDEELPPFELPAMYQTSGDSLADSDHYQDHLTSHWGF